MANDIIDINVYETVETVSITVNPNLTTVNINKVTGGGGGGGVTNLSTTQTASNFTINSDTGDDALVPLGNGTLAGATLNDYTTVEKNKLGKYPSTATNGKILQGNGTSYVEIDTPTDTTNLGYTPSPTNGTVTSSTGDDATIPLADSTNAGLFTPSEKSKLSGIATGAEVNVNADWNAVSGDAQILNKPTISGSNTGDQDLQSVTTLGASTTNPINVLTTSASNAITGQSGTGTGVNGISDGGTGIDGYSNSGVGVSGYSETGIGGSFDTDSASANIANFKQSGSIVASVTNNGNINANGFVKSGGTSSQILVADGSVITAGTNITITGGQISSVGGSGGGGSSVNYYLNGGTSQGTFGGTTYYEFSKTAIIGTGADFSRGTNGYIASFITDVADPSLLLIPAGNWNLEFFFSSSSAGGSPSFYVELYKYDGTTFTLITSSSATPEGITNGTAIDAYFTPLAVPETILTVNDRLAIRVFVNASSKTITLHTQNGHLCEVITTFTAGLTALNGLQAQVQNFATGTTGTDFAINSSGSTHTFNLPSASATARGVVTTSSQTFAGDKTFTGTIGASNLSGTNTGDQDLSGLVVKNTAITGATKTKITYDSKGLVTAGVDATTADIADSTNKRYVTDANLVIIGNTSGTNTGDNATNTQYSGLATSKQDTLQSTVNIKSINGNSLLGSGDLTISGGGSSSQAAYTILANNTNATAVPTAQVFKDVGEQSYAGATPTWTGTTAPSGATNHSYQWSQIGKVVNLRVNLDYATSGTSLTAVTFDLPSDCPIPKLPLGVSANGDVIAYGNGMLTALRAVPTTPTTVVCTLRIKTTGTYEINIIRNTALGHKYAYATIQYFAQ